MGTLRYHTKNGARSNRGTDFYFYGYVVKLMRFEFFAPNIGLFVNMALRLYQTICLTISHHQKEFEAQRVLLAASNWPQTVYSVLTYSSKSVCFIGSTIRGISIFKTTLMMRHLVDFQTL